ncbi:cyclophilin-like fold protein [Bacteroides caecigallinarum]|uniref:cyclophilin-like fold protein n=1 Tax=Bacteroides caecigallinarum TaxID=1411144 RepID=UPI001958DF4E|nr:cyclophilin-like fold protein [Bacteroides caecigallinarum]
MGKARLLFFIFIYSMFAMACSTEPEIPSGNGTETEISNDNNNQDEENTNNDNQNNSEENMSNSTIKISVNGTTLTATLKDNVSTRALVNLLKEGPLTINMNDYAGMEKVGPIGTTLPQCDERLTTQPGDLILYRGQYFVIYYAQNTYSLTPLGKIDNITNNELIKILGNGDVTVTISLDE